MILKPTDIKAALKTVTVHTHTNTNTHTSLCFSDISNDKMFVRNRPFFSLFLFFF